MNTSIEALIGRVWALEPRFHNIQAALLTRKLEQSKDSVVVINDAEKKAGWTDSNGKYHYGWSVSESRSGKVALIPIMGVMSRYGDLCSYGTEDIASMILTANNELPEISAIVLEIDSPGGEVNGTEMLGTVVHQSKKPVVAYVKGMAASAAYWVASQANEIIMESETSSDVGSIGVLSVHVDASQFYADKGLKVTIIRSEGSENKALFNEVEPLTDELLASIQAELSVIREQFVKTVKAGRPGIGDVFSGKMYSGKEALKLGMADRIGFLGDAIRRADLLARR